MKKVLSIVLLLSILASLCAAPATAATEDWIIFAPNGDDAYRPIKAVLGSQNTIEKNYLVAYGGSDYSFVWENIDETDAFGNANNAIYSRNLAHSDISRYGYVNFNMYSEKATGQQIELKIGYDITDADGVWCRSKYGDEVYDEDGLTYWQHYYRYDFTVNWSGWKTFSIPINGSFYDRKANRTVSDWGAEPVYCDYIAFNRKDITDNTAEGASYYLDRAWLSETEYETEQPDTYVLIDADKNSGTAAYSSGSVKDVYASYDKTITYKDRPTSIKWSNISSAKNFRWNTSGEFLGDYSYVNIRMYSHKANRQPLLVEIQYTNSACTSANPRLRYTVYADWEGWKTISIPISSFAHNASDANHWEDLDTKVTTIQLTTNYSDYASFADIANSVYNIDLMWLSKTDSSDSAVTEGKIFVLADYETASYNNRTDENGNYIFAAAAVDSQSAALGAFTYDEIITANGAARSLLWNDFASKTTVYYNSSPSERNRYRVYTYPLTAVNNTAYQYINVLLYSAKTSDKSIELRAYYTADGVDGNYAYLYKSIPIDWTGWKQICVPISQMNNKSNERNSTVYSWDNGDMTITTVGLYADSSSGVAQAMQDAGCSFNIDSIWLSEDECTMISAPSEENRKIDDTHVTLVFNREFDAADISPYISVRKNGEAIVSGEDYYVSSFDNEIYVKFAENLTGGAEYIVEFNPSGIYSTQRDLFAPASFAFTTEKAALNVDTSPVISENGGMACAQLDVRNASDTASPFTMIIAAYDKQTDSLLDCAIEKYSVYSATDKQIRAELDVSSFDNYYVKAFVWNTMSELAPYVKERTFGK